VNPVAEGLLGSSGFNGEQSGALRPVWEQCGELRSGWVEEVDLGLGWRAGGVERRRLVRHAEGLADSAQLGRIGHERDHLAAPAAA
jgi:hypothetical protein